MRICKLNQYVTGVFNSTYEVSERTDFLLTLARYIGLDVYGQRMKWQRFISFLLNLH